MVTIRTYADGSIYAAINGRDIGEVHSYTINLIDACTKRVTLCFDAGNVANLYCDEVAPIPHRPEPGKFTLIEEPRRSFWDRAKFWKK
jgi:hypothetical protein